jgi:hypothetical protein
MADRLLRVARLRQEIHASLRPLYVVLIAVAVKNPTLIVKVVHA